MKRKFFENNLIYLGFIIISNKLKRDTKTVTANLIERNCELIIATDDDPFTSISVAGEYELIENSKNYRFS
jgi:magnesium-transporting ATPase (P-type)